MVFTKTEEKWIIEFTGTNGEPAEWWHPLSIQNVQNLSERIEVTEEMLERIFSSPEAAEQLILFLKRNSETPYSEIQP